MRNRGEAYLCAVSGEKYVNCQLNILLELDELLGNLDDTLRYALASSSHLVPFHF